MPTPQTTRFTFSTEISPSTFVAFQSHNNIIPFQRFHYSRVDVRQIIITHNLSDIARKPVQGAWDDERRRGWHPGSIVSSNPIRKLSHPCVIDKAFPELLEHAINLELAAIDPTEHGDIPEHNNLPPRRRPKKQLLWRQLGQCDRRTKMKRTLTKQRCRRIDAGYLRKSVARYSDIRAFSLHAPAFTQLPPHVLALSSTFPGIKAKVHGELQGRAERDKAVFKGLWEKETSDADSLTIESFIKNCHAVDMLKGKKWGVGEPVDLTTVLQSDPNTAATHLGLATLRTLMAKGLTKALLFETSGPTWSVTGQNGIQGFAGDAASWDGAALLDNQPNAVVSDNGSWIQTINVQKKVKASTETVHYLLPHRVPSSTTISESQPTKVMPPIPTKTAATSKKLFWAGWPVRDPLGTSSAEVRFWLLFLIVLVAITQQTPSLNNMRVSNLSSFIALVASASLISASPMASNTEYQVERRSNAHLERRLDFWLEKRGQIDDIIVQLSARGNSGSSGSTNGKASNSNFQTERVGRLPDSEGPPSPQSESLSRKQRKELEATAQKRRARFEAANPRTVDPKLPNFMGLPSDLKDGKK
ncbi:hypothetical protein C8J56DRAFT_1065823 [Mycena floridula]|nr:hypothetical protein C8J56DRAFT_1065823 [Mycena floridula]